MRVKLAPPRIRAQQNRYLSLNPAVWQKCLKHLEAELTSQQYNTWIRPLHVVEKADELKLFAPNRFVLDWIRDKYSARI